MAETMKAQAQEIERLRVELQRTSIKQKEDISELTSGSPAEFVQEKRVTQWMRLRVGALKEFLDKVGGPLQRPTDHAGASSHGESPPPARSCASLPCLGGVVQVPYRLHDQVYCKGWSGAKRAIAVWIPRASRRRLGQ